MSQVAGPVLIAGGGIGGLLAALALRRAGIAATVFERVPALREIGAGLTLQPNAILALRTLGLDAAVLAAGELIRCGRLQSASGRVLSELGEEAYAAVGAPAVGIHRGTLQRVFLEELGAEGPRTGHTVTRYVANASSVTVHFAEGGSAEGAVLVGADGLRSAVRGQLLRDGEPTYAGYTAWRGVATDRIGEPGVVTETWGRGRRFGAVPIDGGRTYWFATHNASAGGRHDSELARETLLRLFYQWPEPIRELLLATPREGILRSDIHDRPRASRWGEGRVTLLGDAAHPMTPNLGQGACQAIEDAVVLARCLAAGDALAEGPMAALRQYEDRRRARADAVVTAARRLGAIGQCEGVLACRVRDTLMALVPARMARQQAAAAWTFPG